jgi:asparagine synthase (glutamine-hydrolysing)
MGFGVPMGAWLRGPLQEWAEELLSEKRLKETGLVAVAPVREWWADHLAGNYNYQMPLWSILMFQAWQEKIKKYEPTFAVRS